MILDQNSMHPKNFTTMNTDRERNLFFNYIKCAKSVIEFGSGGSTFDLCNLTGDNTKIYSIEGSKKWYNYMLKWKFIREKIKQGKLEYKHTNIGKTGKWCYPIENNKNELFRNYYSILESGRAKEFDLVFIDGRFRVMCGLLAIKNCNKSIIILIHDFIREEYQILLKYLNIIEFADSLYAFKIKSQINEYELINDIEQYRYDYR